VSILIFKFLKRLGDTQTRRIQKASKANFYATRAHVEGYDEGKPFSEFPTTKLGKCLRRQNQKLAIVANRTCAEALIKKDLTATASQVDR